MFNLDRKRLIPNAPVKNQCSGDYFYGKDEQLERAIQLVESSYSAGLKTMIESRCLPTEGGIQVFRMFWLFQHLHTEAAAQRAVEMSESARMLADMPVEDFALGIKEAVQIAVRVFASSMHEMSDLRFCLVRNKTQLPFITSDNPAVLTNRWHLECDRSRGLSFGLGSAGAITLLPVTPDLLFLGYDGDVYSIPHVGGIVDVKSERDVMAFNQHQFLNCNANVYVHDARYAEFIHEHYTQIESIRPQARHLIYYAQLDKVLGEHARYVVVAPERRDKTKQAIMHSRVIHPHPKCWPRHIRTRTKGSVFTNGSGMGYIRRAGTSTPYRVPFWRERA